MPHGGAEAVDVGTRIGLGLAVLFGGGIARGAERDGVLARFVFVFTRNTQVDQLHVAVGVKHDVAGLHVAVDHRRVLPMQVAYGIADLQHPSLHIFFRLRPLLAHHLVKRLALNVVHHHIDVILGFLEVHDVHDAGMAEPRKQVGFTRQALLDRTASRVGCVAVNLLDGPLLVAQPKVGCKEHPARAAPADKAENLVAALYDIALNQAALTMLAHQRSLPPSRGKASAVA